MISNCKNFICAFKEFKFNTPFIQETLKHLDKNQNTLFFKKKKKNNTKKRSLKLWLTLSDGY